MAQGTFSTKGSGVFAPILEALHTSFMGFDPEMPSEIISFFEEMPDFFDEFAQILSNTASNIESTQPLDSSIPDGLNEMAATIAGLRDSANDLNGNFHAKHETEIQRIEEPRPNEQAWDVGREA